MSAGETAAREESGPSAVKTCTKCGETKPLEAFREGKSKGRTYRRGACRECEREYFAKWRAENPDYNAKWYAENREWKREYGKKYSAKWYAENRERKRDYAAKYHAENPDVSRAAAARRRARERNLPDDGSGVTDWLWHHEETDSWYCHLCGGTFEPGDVIEWDHRDPLSERFTGDAPKAGTVVANMAAAHETCNNARLDVPLNEWHERVGTPPGIV